MFSLNEILLSTYSGRLQSLQDKGIKIVFDPKNLIKYKKLLSNLCNLKLLPILENHKYGFIDKEGNIKICPEYDDYKGSFLIPANNDICVKKDNKWGVISSDGDIVIDCIYSCIKPSTLEFEEIYYDDGRSKRIYYDTLYTVNNGYKWAILDKHGDIIVDFGVYDWIDGYDSGLARVRKGKKWGIIDYTGKIVLPIKYDEVWGFYGKDRTETLIKKDNVKLYVKFSDLVDNENRISVDDETEKNDINYSNAYVDKSAYDNSYYNDSLDFDQQDQEFWESL